MTVVLLDPSRPDMVPAGAVGLMTGRIAVTEEVHPSLLWQLPEYVLVGNDAEQLPVLVTSDRGHPAVVARLAASERLIQALPQEGSTLLYAVALMDRLRSVGPWEQQQTHDSLRRYLLEEVYELLDAIDHGSREDLRSELGDLLLQVLFHARIAADSAVGAFDINDVAQSFIDKVSTRTPGVLGGLHLDLEKQIAEWEEAKAAELSRGSVLDGIATGQPALALTQKIFERLSTADFPIAAVSPSLYSVTVPYRRYATVNAEDEQRQRALALMDQVRAAEAAAKAEGVYLRDENTWRRFLGLDYVEDDNAAASADFEGEDEWIADDVDGDDADPDGEGFEDVSLDADPIDSGKKSKRKVKGVKVKKNVPPLVVVEKWSAAQE